MLVQLENEFPQDVRVILRHFPLTNIHDKAALSAQAVEAAGLQGKFWEMHDILFEKWDEWKSMSVDAFSPWLKEQALSLELDQEQFAIDLESDTIKGKVETAAKNGSRIGIPGTPFLVINGQPYSGPQDQWSLGIIIKLVLLEKRQYASCPPNNIDPFKEYTATIVTQKGEIVLELFAEQAPIAVNSFIFLASEGWFDGITFHRVMPGFVAQTGDPSGTGYGGPGYAFRDEISPALNFDQPGLVAMANSGPNSNGSQFFITFSALPNLNNQYTIFGRVISGMDIAKSLTTRDPSKQGDLPPGDIIQKIIIDEQ